jgi:hypothetical protein
MIDARSRKAGPDRAQDPAVAAKIKRSAWTIAAIAAFFYVGFIAWNLWRASQGF